MKSKDKIVHYYNELAKDYDQHRFGNTYGQFIDKQERKILRRLLGNKNSELIVDLACGTGRLLEFASVGVDASTEMLSVAHLKHPTKQLLLASAEQVPLEDESVDTIISFHFFMHLNPAKVDEVLTEIRRLLKEGGRLIFDIPSKKRRSLFNYKKGEWHGAFSLTKKEIAALPGFKVKASFGYLFFPIHRFPTFIRPFFVAIDSFLANSLLKEYSSYLVIELEKDGSLN